MTTDKDLIDMLRTKQICTGFKPDGHGDVDIVYGPDPVTTKAADRIEQLTAERDEATNQLDSSRYSVEVLEKRVAGLMAERDRLREAAKHVTGKVLHDIFVQRMGHAYVDDDHTDLTGVNMDGYFNLVQIAEDILAALKGETP